MATTYQIYSTNNYVYAATNEGLKIYNLDEDLEAYINRQLGFSAVYGNDSTILLGTKDDGVKYLSTSTISGSKECCMSILRHPL